MVGNLMLVEASLKALSLSFSRCLITPYSRIISITNNETPLATGTIKNQTVGELITDSKTTLEWSMKLIGAAFRNESHWETPPWKDASTNEEHTARRVLTIKTERIELLN
jgi:hypothetical protein